MGVKTRGNALRKPRRKTSKTAVQEEVGEEAGLQVEDAAICPQQPGGEGGVGGEDGVGVSLESLVALPDPALQQQYRTAIFLLKSGQCGQAVEQLVQVSRAATALPSYGQYRLDKRTQNKRTSLSALHVFTAIAWRGLARPKKAVQACNKAIGEDPGWEIPFSRRSEYLRACLAGMGKEAGQLADQEADLVVEAGRGDQHGPRIYSDLQQALDAAPEGATISLGPGTHFREEGFRQPAASPAG